MTRNPKTKRLARYMRAKFPENLSPKPSQIGKAWLLDSDRGNLSRVTTATPGQGYASNTPKNQDKFQAKQPTWMASERVASGFTRQQAKLLTKHSQLRKCELDLLQNAQKPLHSVAVASSCANRGLQRKKLLFVPQTEGLYKRVTQRFATESESLQTSLKELLPSFSPQTAQLKQLLEENSLFVARKSKQSQRNVVPYSHDTVCSQTVEYLVSYHNLISLEPFKLISTERSSPFKRALRETNKLRLLYGCVSRRDILSVIKQATRSKSRTIDKLIQLLESRLDVTVYRAGFCATIFAAKQMIRSGVILVNTKTTRSEKYHVVPGDVIQVVTNNNENAEQAELGMKTQLCMRLLKEESLFSKPVCKPFVQTEGLQRNAQKLAKPLKQLRFLEQARLPLQYESKKQAEKSNAIASVTTRQDYCTTLFHKTQALRFSRLFLNKQSQSFVSIAPSYAVRNQLREELVKAGASRGITLHRFKTSSFLLFTLQNIALQQALVAVALQTSVCTKACKKQSLFQDATSTQQIAMLQNIAKKTDRESYEPLLGEKAFNTVCQQNKEYAAVSRLFRYLRNEFSKKATATALPSQSVNRNGLLYKQASQNSYLDEHFISMKRKHSLLYLVKNLSCSLRKQQLFIMRHESFPLDKSQPGSLSRKANKTIHDVSSEGELLHAKLQHLTPYQSNFQETHRKALHLEVSYKRLCAIVLYPPQSACLRAALDLELILKQLSL